MDIQMVWGLMGLFSSKGCLCAKKIHLSSVFVYVCWSHFQLGFLCVFVCPCLSSPDECTRLLSALEQRLCSARRR